MRGEVRFEGQVVWGNKWIQVGKDQVHKARSSHGDSQKVNKHGSGYLGRLNESLVALVSDRQ